MEFEFDKEMDALLRQTAKDENVLPTNGTQNHLDPDEISAFAENALPGKARSRITKHLADCNSCRVSLSNLIVLNSEAETEIKAASIATETSETEAVSAAVPWYKKLFAYQNLAYGLGALVILFAGFTALIVFQNVYNSGSSEVAQADESAQNTSTMSAPEAKEQTTNEEVAADDVLTDSNTATANSAPLTETKDDVSVDAKVAQTPLSQNQKENMPADNKQRVGRLNDRVEQTEGKRAGEDGNDNFGDLRTTKPGKTENKPVSPVSETQIAEESEPVPAPAKVARDGSPITTRGGDKTLSKEKKETAKDDRERDNDAAKLSSGNRQQVGGKTFRRANGVWIDTGYNNQKTTNIRRGTSQYLQLDSGLRAITDNLSGIVIVVWKSKAYRIE